MDWQPIETAPKDGTHVLGYGTDWNGKACITEIEHYVYDMEYSDGSKEYKEYWTWSGHFGYDMDGDECDFTHWAPLPTPPETTP